MNGIPTKRDFADAVRQKAAELNQALANAASAGLIVDMTKTASVACVGRASHDIIKVAVYDRI